MAEVRTRIRITDNATNALNKINAGYARLLRTMNSVSGTSVNMSGAMNNGTQAIKKQAEAADMLTKKLLGVAKAYLGIMGAKAIIGTADDLTSSNNRLVNLGISNGKGTDAAVNFSSETMDKIFNSAQRAATGYTAMAKNVSKTVTLAGEAFGSSLETQIDNAIVFQEIMAKSYILGGASAQEQASSMYQLTQALGAGVLAGDELRSVREGAPLAYQQIEKFAQSTLGSEKALKDLASQGLITSDIVVGAVMSMSGDVEKAFEYVKKNLTFGQLWTKFKNETTRAFQPFLEKLREISNLDAFQNITKDIIWFVNVVANVLTGVLTMLSGVIKVLGNNSGLVRALLVALAGAIGVLLVNAISLKLIPAIKWLRTEFLAKNATLLVVIGIIALLVWWFTEFGVTCQSIGNLLLWVAFALVLVSGVMAVLNITVWGISAALMFWIAVIVLVLAAFLLFTDKIVGAVFWLGATLWNIVVGLVNGIIQFMWTKFVEPFIGIIEWILNACNGGFDSLGGAVANLIGQIISWFLSLGKVVTKIIDAIFGTDWTSGLNSLQSSVLSWGKTETAITLDRNAPEVLHRIDATDAYSKGATVGAGWQNSINGFFEGKTGGSTNQAVANLDDLGTGVANIDENTGKMSKSMDTSAEDLKYLRLLAEKEAINKFTTAEIRVDMTNNNTMNNMGDLDGIVTHLDRVLREELSVLAEGVHA